MAVVPTPLTADESADLDGAERVTDFLASRDVALFALGSAGEGMNLTEEVRVQTARRMAEVNDGRTLLLVGAGAFSVKQALTLIDKIADTKIDGVHVIPYDGKVSGEAVEAMYLAIADRSPLPLWLYQNTTRTNGIPLETVKRLREHPNIAGCKLAGVDLRLNQRFIALQTPQFQIVGAADAQFFTFACLGLCCHSSSTISYFPELFIDLYETIQNGELVAAREKNRAVMKFVARVPKGAYQHNGESTAEAKYILSLRGMCQPHCAAPFRPLNESEQETARAVYEDYERYLRDGVLIS
ncbi:MAG: dihydrodipicolinate synthase family protein [Rhodospirillales bacterium]|nr:dihydrodipicolinate synthase family protein [Rhodospirillales bacterium]